MNYETVNIPDTKFPIVPLGKKRAASLPVNSAALACKAGKNNIKITICHDLLTVQIGRSLSLFFLVSRSLEFFAKPFLS